DIRRRLYAGECRNLADDKKGQEHRSAGSKEGVAILDAAADAAVHGIVDDCGQQDRNHESCKQLIAQASAGGFEAPLPGTGLGGEVGFKDGGNRLFRRHWLPFPSLPIFEPIMPAPSGKPARPLLTCNSIRGPVQKLAGSRGDAWKAARLSGTAC